MSDDTIHGRDINGDEWTAYRNEDTSFTGHAAEIDLRLCNTLWLDAAEAARLAAFLLAAAGPDAAREALAKLAPWPFDGETPLETVERLMREKNVAETRANGLRALLTTAPMRKDLEAAIARAERAEKRLAALVVASCKALASFRDALPYVPEYFREKYDYEASANEFSAAIDAADAGAEEPTGATT